MNRRAFLAGAATALAVTPWRLAALERARTVRIGVFGLFQPAELVVRAAAGHVLFIDDGRGATAVLRDAGTAQIALSGAHVVAHATGRTLSAQTLRVTNAAGSGARFELSVPGRIAREFLGTLDVRLFRDALVPVVTMDLDVAVASVTAAEQTADVPLEALKAQAIAARSYLAAAPGRHDGFDACDTTHCQFLREPQPAAHPAARAARDTAGLVLTFRGMPLVALYSASCGGRTRSLAEAGLGDEAYPYYPVDCGHCRAHAEPWTRALPLDALTERLLTDRTEAARLAVVRRDGWSAVPGPHFDAVREEDRIILRGRGSGHAVGLCQAGAAALAREGATMGEILRHYYPSTVIA